MSLTAWTREWTGRGGDPAERTDLTAPDRYVGDARSTYSQRTQGVALQWTRGAHGAQIVSVLAASALTRFGTQASNLRTDLVGIDASGADRVGYYVSGRLTQRIVGVSYEKSVPAGRRFRADYRYIELPTYVKYGSLARFFLLGTDIGDTFDVPDARGHLLRLRYGFPVRFGKRRGDPDRAPIALFDAAQVVPLPIRNRGGGNASGNEGGSAGGDTSSKTRGGWTLGFALIQPF